MAQKKSGSLRFWVGRSYFLGGFLGQKWADFGRFKSVALPLGLGYSFWAFVGDALRALYLPSARLFVVPGIGIPHIIKVAQNGVK